MQHISRSLEGASRAGAAAQVHPDKCKHPHATSAFEVLGNANQQLQSEEVMHELRHVLTLARGAPAACACKDVRRGGLCHGALRPHRALGALLSSARADRAADCACLGTEVRAVWGCLEAAACVSRRRPLVRLFSARVPGAASREALGSAVGLVPLGTMGRGLPGSLQARGARLRTLPAPPEATLARAATQSAEVARRLCHECSACLLQYLGTSGAT